MKAIVLVENTASLSLPGEHGLSLYIEHRNRRILLDAGQSDLFARNARALGVDLNTVDTAVLSHGHFDHANGFDAFLDAVPEVCVHARPAAFLPQYHGEEYIGLKESLRTACARRFALSAGPEDLGDGIFLIPDSVEHEQSLVLATDAGLVVFNSCSHAGAGHIAADICRQFPGEKIAAYIGGFHLMGKTGPDSLGVEPGIVKNLAAWLLEELGVGAIYTGHCTGAPAFALLQEAGGDRVMPLHTGSIISLGE